MRTKNLCSATAVVAALFSVLSGCGGSSVMSGNDASSTAASSGGGGSVTLLAAATVVTGSFFDQVLAVMNQCGDTSAPVSIDAIVAKQEDNAEPRAL